MKCTAYAHANGEYTEEITMDADNALELLDAILSWDHFEHLGGIDIRTEGKMVSFYPSGSKHFASHKPGQIFDQSRVGDLEYVEMMVADVWDRALREKR